MANQPLPSRPWLILGSMRPYIPPPAPASQAPDAQPQAQAQPPASRPIFRPTFNQAFKPSTQPQQQPPQSPPAATAAPPFRVGNVSSLPSSQKTTLPSEKIKTPAPPSSPLTMPPAHVKFSPEPIEQKTMLIEKPNPPFKHSNGGLQKDVGDTATAKLRIVPDYEKREQTKDMGAIEHKGNNKKADSEDASIKIITFAGDSKGAIMELSPASKKHEPEGNSNKLTKINPKTWLGSKLGSNASGSEEEKSKKMDKTQNKIGTPSSAMNAFMNSNVQAVNNSILVNTSCTYHDPGVRVFFSRGGGRGLHHMDCGHGQNN